MKKSWECLHDTHMTAFPKYVLFVGLKHALNDNHIRDLFSSQAAFKIMHNNN